MADVRIAINCYERIARFHTLSLHLLAQAQPPYDQYDAQQEKEQLDKTLLSLMQYYDDSRGRLQSPNEPEFRAYCIIFQIQDPVPNLEDRMQTWPKDILKSPRVQRALKVYTAACNTADIQGPLRPNAPHSLAQENWRRFFSTIRSNDVSFLMSCVAETYFPLLRKTSLGSIWQAYRSGSQMQSSEWSLRELVGVLGFDNAEEVEEFVYKFGFTVEERDDGYAYLNLNSISGKHLPEVRLTYHQSWLVEYKRHYRSPSAVISGMSVKAASEAGQIEESFEGDLEMDMDEMSSSKDDSLFIPDDTAKTTSSRPSVNTWNDQKAIDKTLTAASSKDITPAISKGIAPFSPFSKFSAPPEQTKQRSLDFGSTSNASVIPSSTPKPFFDVKQSSSGLGAPLLQAQKPATSFVSSKTSLPDVAKKDEVSANQNPLQSNPFSFDDTNSNPFSLSKVNPFRPSSPSPFGTPTSTTLQTSLPQTKPFIFGSQPTPNPFAPTAPPSGSSIGKANSAKQQLNSQPQDPLFEAQQTTANVATPQPQQAPFSSKDLFGLKIPVVESNKPKHPSPLSQSFTAAAPHSLFPSISGSTKNLASTAATSAQEAQRARDQHARRSSQALGRLARIMITEQYGFLDQFIEFMATPLVQAAQEQLRNEKLCHEADQFRLGKIMIRYGKRWRETFWRRRISRQGHERRKQAREAAQKAEKVQEKDDLETFRASQELLRQSQDNSRSSSVLSRSRSPPRREPRPMSSAVHLEKRVNQSRYAQSLPSLAVASAPHRRSRSTLDNIMLPPPVPSKDISRPSNLRHQYRPDSSNTSMGLSRETGPLDTTRSTYFRLKAMGLDPSSNNLVPPVEALRSERKRSRISDSEERAFEPRKRSATLPSVSNSLSNDQDSTNNTASMADDDDEVLFAAVRQTREAMGESISFFRDELKRDEEQRSRPSSSASSHQNFRPELSNGHGSSHASSVGSNSMPVHAALKYRTRISKFLPRDRYADALIAKGEKLESRASHRSMTPARKTAPAVTYTSEALSENKSPPMIVMNDSRSPPAPLRGSSPPQPIRALSTSPTQGSMLKSSLLSERSHSPTPELGPTETPLPTNKELSNGLSSHVYAISPSSTRNDFAHTEAQEMASALIQGSSTGHATLTESSATFKSTTSLTTPPITKVPVKPTSAQKPLQHKINGHAYPRSPPKRVASQNSFAALLDLDNEESSSESASDSDSADIGDNIAGVGQLDQSSKDEVEGTSAKHDSDDAEHLQDYEPKSRQTSFIFNDDSDELEQAPEYDDDMMTEEEEYEEDSDGILDDIPAKHPDGAWTGKGGTSAEDAIEL